MVLFVGPHSLRLFIFYYFYFLNFSILLFFQFFCFLNILLIPFCFIFQPQPPFLHAVWGSSVSVLVIIYGEDSLSQCSSLVGIWSHLHVTPTFRKRILGFHLHVLLSHAYTLIDWVAVHEACHAVAWRLLTPCHKLSRILNLLQCEYVTRLNKKVNRKSMPEELLKLTMNYYISNNNKTPKLMWYLRKPWRAILKLTHV